MLHDHFDGNGKKFYASSDTIETLGLTKEDLNNIEKELLEWEEIDIDLSKCPINMTILDIERNYKEYIRK